jgi:hypothetical protein
MKIDGGMIFRLLMVLLLLASPVVGAEIPADEGTIFTLWPLVDYRSSPKEGFSNLSILGPLFKYQKNRDETLLAVRPLFYRDNNVARETVKTDYLYPVFSSESGPDVERVQALRGLFQINTYRKSEVGGEDESSMFFPFFVKGNSPKYGPYLWVFPFYGSAYEKFWRDEYHFVMFPLYGRTVNKGTTTRNYLYPFFATTEGEQESGFKIWPLYGQSQKEGVYEKQFLAWPIFFYEKLGLNTDNPVTTITALPLFTITDSPQITSRRFLWPFFGYTENRSTGVTEIDWLWPFWVTARGGGMEVNRFLPFYADEQSPGKSKQWFLWPVYRHDRIETESFEQDRRRIVFFLFNDFQERWPKADKSRRRTMLWPLFVYRRDERGVSSFSFPAPVEPVFDKEGIEKSWAPLWRLYQQRWNDSGDSAVSLLWNLYWHEVRGDDLAYEFFPLVSYQSGGTTNVDLKLLKGLLRYRSGTEGTTLNFFWLPFGISWGGVATEQGQGSSSERIH